MFGLNLNLNIPDNLVHGEVFKIGNGQQFVAVICECNEVGCFQGMVFQWEDDDISRPPSVEEIFEDENEEWKISNESPLLTLALWAQRKEMNTAELLRVVMGHFIVREAMKSISNLIDETIKDIVFQTLSDPNDLVQ